MRVCWKWLSRENGIIWVIFISSWLFMQCAVTMSIPINWFLHGKCLLISLDVIAKSNHGQSISIQYLYYNTKYWISFKVEFFISHDNAGKCKNFLEEIFGLYQLLRSETYWNYIFLLDVFSWKLILKINEQKKIYEIPRNTSIVPSVIWKIPTLLLTTSFF